MSPHSPRRAASIRRRPRAAVALVLGLLAVIAYGLSPSHPDLSPARTPSGQYWGVDSVATVPSKLAAVQRDYDATPAFWGRYLADCTGRCGSDLGASEAATDLDEGIDLLLVVADKGGSHDEGSANGQADGREAARAAHALGVPAGVAIFKDLEQQSPANASYITAWYDAVSGAGYEPGFYLNALAGDNGGSAFCRAVRLQARIGSSYLWASENEPTGGASTPPRQAPAMTQGRWPAAFPSCGGRGDVWQYSEADHGGVDEDLAVTLAPFWHRSLRQAGGSSSSDRTAWSIPASVGASRRT